MRRRDGYIQLEVSEWTLPGPSVGDVTDEGVGASCQPPFVCVDKIGSHLASWLHIKQHDTILVQMCFQG